LTQNKVKFTRPIQNAKLAILASSIAGVVARPLEALEAVSVSEEAKKEQQNLDTNRARLATKVCNGKWDGG
jgi:hypothetical protein